MTIKKLAGYTMVALLALVFSFATANATEPKDAVAWTQKAATYYKENGREAALKAFTEDSQFKKGELYVYVLDKKGVMVAHGAKATLIGKDFLKFSDTTGKRFGKEILEITDTGWVDYYWLNPVMSKVMKKKTYVIKTDDDFICVGIYVKE